jgi:dihydropteroate synthase
MTGVGAATSLDVGGEVFDIEHRAAVFGVLCGDDLRSTLDLLRRAEQLIDEGADVLDLGEAPPPAELSFPGCSEYDWVESAAEQLGDRFDVPVAAVARHPFVVRQAARSGVSVVSDPTGGNDPDYLTAVADLGLSLVVKAPTAGRGLGRPGSAGEAHRLLELPGTVRSFLAERAARAEAAGVPRHRILLDAGVDAGAPVAEARHLLQGCAELVALGYPVVLSTVTSGEPLAGQSPDPWPVTAAQAFAIGSGCRVLRTTDVRGARRVADVLAEILAARREEPE